MITNPLILSLMISLPLSLGQKTASQEKKVPKYVGVTQCAPCHRGAPKGSQLETWQKSKHSGAYRTLRSAKADSIASAKGLKSKASEASQCLKCHATGYDLPAASMLVSYKKEDGVQCETCHGAGLDYRPIPIMRDRAKSVAAGLVVWKDDASIEKFCQSCHNSESPTFKEFDFEKEWEKVKHPAPKKG